MITFHGTVTNISNQLVQAADSIKFLNYKTTTPAKFQKRTLTEDIAKELMSELSDLIKIPQTDLDYVYFSACQGAEPHVDMLDPDKFTSRTFVIPITLPNGLTKITAESESMIVHVGGVYEFNHEKIHSMEVEDPESGCVVIMVAIKNKPNLNKCENTCPECNGLTTKDHNSYECHKCKMLWPLVVQ